MLPTDQTSLSLETLLLALHCSTSLASVRSFESDLDSSNNTASVTVGTPQLPVAPTPAAPVVRPLLGKAVTTPAMPLAGKRFTFTLAVERSDTGAPLKTGKMVCNPTVAGKLIKHAESFKAGTARLSFVVPRTAKGKLLKIKLKIVSGSQTTSRTYNYKVR